MDKFMISDKPTGPWLELREYKTPQDALEAAKAGFQWVTVFVAKMREADAADLFPPSFVDDLTENLVLRHGNALADEIIQRIRKNQQPFMDGVWEAGTAALQSDEEGPIWVADMVHQYGPLQNTRPSDFNRELQAQISQKKTKEGIEAQRLRQQKEAKELEEWKERQKKPSLEDMM
jgi:hypothetical protein